MHNELAGRMALNWWNTGKRSKQSENSTHSYFVNCVFRCAMIDILFKA